MDRGPHYVLQQLLVKTTVGYRVSVVQGAKALAGTLRERGSST